MPNGTPQSCSGDCAANIAAYIRTWADTLPAPTAEPEPISTGPGVALRFVEKTSLGSSPIASGTAPMIADISNGAAISLANRQYVDIEAIPQNIADVGSISFELSGSATVSRTERAAGYFLQGDEFSFDLQAAQLPAGNYQLTVTVRDSNDQVAADRVVNFSVSLFSEPTAGFNGASFFANNCAGCHGSAGEGTMLVGPASVLQGKVMGRDQVSAIVGRMPSAENPACDGVEGCVEGLTDFLLANFITEEVPVDLAASCESQNGLLQPELRRLTSKQFKNTVESVFELNLSQVNWPEFGDGFPTLGMSNNADTLMVNSINFQSVYNAVDAAVENVIANHGIISNCARSGNDTCVDEVIDNFAPLLWRRPLSNGEVSDISNTLDNLRNSNGSNSEQLELVLKSLMLSSNFLFRNETGSANGGVRNLSPYEIASLMSYAIWDSPPDATLYNLAQNGTLSNPQTISQQVQRMIADPRFNQVLTEFYTDYLKLERVMTVQKIDELNFSPEIRSSLLASAKQTLANGVNDLNASITSPLGNTEFFVNNLIAGIFGLDQSQFGSNLSPSPMPNAQRAGILTHPAFLAVHSKEGASGIVKRGVFTIKQMMCVEFNDPPNNLTEAELPPNIDPATTSTRELLHLQHTSQPVCSNCHSRLDPAGYGYENYDAIGQFRLFEKGSVPIDASGTLLVDDGGSELSFGNSVEYTQALLSTPELESCVTQRLAEYMTGQALTSNACELAKLEAHTATNGSSLESIITGLMQLESIRIRGN